MNKTDLRKNKKTIKRNKIIKGKIFKKKTLKRKRTIKRKKIIKKNEKIKGGATIEPGLMREYFILAMYYILKNEIYDYHGNLNTNEYTVSKITDISYFTLDGDVLEENDNNSVILIENKGIIILYFYSGKPFYIDVYNDNKSTNIPRILSILKDKYRVGYKLIICGHSMGAGLTYLNTLDICDFINAGEFNIKFSDIYVYTTGLGRIYTPLIHKFKSYYEIYNFNYVDIIYGDGIYIDGYLDYILIMKKSCNPLDSNAPFYCNNIIKNGSSPDKKPLYSHNHGNYNTNFSESVLQSWFEGKNAYALRKTRELEQYDSKKDKELLMLERSDIEGIEDIEDYRRLECWNNDWGGLYSDKWNKCQELFDKIYSHNTVNTFKIMPGFNISSVAKNDILKTGNLNDLFWHNGLPRYHSFIYYYRCLI